MDTSQQRDMSQHSDSNIQEEGDNLRDPGCFLVQSIRSQKITTRLSVSWDVDSEVSSHRCWPVQGQSTWLVRRILQGQWSSENVMTKLEGQGVGVLLLFHQKESTSLHGKTIYMVGARLTMPLPQIYQWRSSGENWVLFLPSPQKQDIHTAEELPNDP